MASNRLTVLANTIAESTKIITEYLASKNLPVPSFDVNGLTELSISPADKEAWTARSKEVAATKELHDLTVGPKESLRHLAWDVRVPPILSAEDADNIRNSPSIVSRFELCTTSMWQKQFPSTVM